MKRNFALFLFFLTVLTDPGQKNQPQYDSLLAVQLGADERGMKTYVPVILRTGPSDIKDNETDLYLWYGSAALPVYLEAAGRIRKR